MHLTGRTRNTAVARASWLVGLLTAIASTAAAQTTASLTVAKDATIRGGGYASTRYGSDNLLVTRRSDDDAYERRAVLTFDTETTIPDNTHIGSAKLVLTVRGGNSETRRLEAHSIPVSFDEPYVTWKSRKSGVSWRYAGGEVTGSPATATVTATPGSQVTFDVTAMVQKVINGDFGSRYARFLVADGGATSRDSYREYHSGEASTSAHRPRLVVTYGGTATSSGSASTTGGDVVLAAGAATTLAGKWVKASDSSAAGGVAVRHPNANAAKITTAQGSPSNYFEMTFTAEAGKAYRLWLHGRAENNYWGNDSVFVQFSGSVTKAGSATYRIGTASAAEVNLEDCGGCGLSGWKWQDNGYGAGVLGPAIYFASTGTQRIRVQTREDGLSIDRIVLSPASYLSSAPPAFGSTGSTTTTTTPPTTTSPTSPTPTAPSTTSSTLKVLDWNIHHGAGMDGVYNIDRQAAFIASTGAHVVSLNEVERYTGWGNEDQPARFAALLKSKTGKTWHYRFAQSAGGTTGHGNLLLSVYPFESVDDYLMSYGRSVVQAAIIVNGRRVTIFSTHLDAESSSRRSTQISELTRWASGFPEVRILAGDFNAWPGAAEIAKMTSGHYDVWAEAKKQGTAVAFAGNDAGNTRNSRIDYVWLSKGASNVVIKAARVFDARDPRNGTMLSDHRPLLGTFEIR